MKKSEQFKNLANEEDNDLKALGLYTKSLREKRFEKFEDYIPKLLDKGYKITDCGLKGYFKIHTTIIDIGTIEYYSKANKIFFRNSKKKIWQSRGLNWIINNLLK